MSETGTIWRQMLADNWEEIRRKTDWKGIPQIHDYVARLMTGRPNDQRGDWLAHSFDLHLAPLAQKLGRPLNMVSFGCGTGDIEAAILHFGWPIASLVACEYDAELLRSAEAKLAPFPVTKSFQVFDFNAPSALDGAPFDIAFFCHSLHHCANLEDFLPYLNGLLGEHGLVLGLDYFGPPRLQLDHETDRLVIELFSLLPKNLRFNLVTEEIEERFQTPSAAAVLAHDPTEAPRSSDLRSLLFSSFPVVEKLPMGGTLLRHLLAQRAGNYRSESDFAILELLMILERELILTRRIVSDDLYFVLRRSDRL